MKTDNYKENKPLIKLYAKQKWKSLNSAYITGILFSSTTDKCNIIANDGENQILIPAAQVIKEDATKNKSSPYETPEDKEDYYSKHILSYIGKPILYIIVSIEYENATFVIKGDHLSAVEKWKDIENEHKKYIYNNMKEV